MIRGSQCPLTPPKSSPKIFGKNSFSKSPIKICILCTPPYGGDDVMRIPVPNPLPLRPPHVAWTLCCWDVDYVGDLSWALDRCRADLYDSIGWVHKIQILVLQKRGIRKFSNKKVSPLFSRFVLFVPIVSLYVPYIFPLKALRKWAPLFFNQFSYSDTPQ